MPLDDERIERLKSRGFEVHWDVEGLLDSMEKSMSKLPPHLERARREKEELDAKIRKLDRFLARDTFPDGMTTQEYDILVRQTVAMDAYSQILAERLALWKRKADG